MNVAIVNLAAGQSHTMAPLGALYVVAALEEAGFEVAFRDYALGHDGNPFAIDRMAAFLAEAATDASMLGISCFSGMLPYALEAARRLRDDRPELRIILGGPGPSATPRAILEHFPQIDAVVFGEGEETAVELAGAIAQGASLDAIEGLAWRDAGDAITLNRARVRRRDLDSVRYPAYDHVDLAKYDVVGVVYARGCPYACTYCDVVSMWKRRNIARSLGNVLDEIRWLRDRFGVRHIAFVDDLFTVDRRRVQKFCEAFQRDGDGMTWGCTTRIDRVDSPLLREMAAAGCNYVFYGVESGSPAILARVNKVIPFEQTIAAVKQSAALGMYVHTPLMWGFPFEEIADFRQTVVFGRYLEHCGAQVFYTLATPLPATALYEEFSTRLRFDPSIYSTIIAPGRAMDLSGVESLIRQHRNIFAGFYHFADGQVDDKIELGRKAGITLSDIRISNLLDHKDSQAAAG